MRKKILLATFFLAVGIFLVGNVALAIPCPEENHPMCRPPVREGDPCGTGRTCQEVTCGDNSSFFDCLSAPPPPPPGEDDCEDIEGADCRITCNDDEDQIDGFCVGMVCCRSNCPATEPACAGKGIGDDCVKNDGAAGECAGRGCDEDKLFCDPNGPPPPPDDDDDPPAGAMWKVEDLSGYGLPSATISDIVEKIVFWLLSLFGFLGIIAFLVSGIMYLTAAGDAEQEKKAKLVMKMSITGIVVGLVGLIAIRTIDAILNAKMGGY